MKKPLRNNINPWGFTALAAYSAFILWRLFFYAYSQNYRQQMSDISYNLMPFKTIMNYLVNSNRIKFDIWIHNLAGNIAAFMPLGFLLPLAFRGLTLSKTLYISFAFVLFAEIMQLVSRRGVYDVDDILLNMLGSAVGYGVYRIFSYLLKLGGKLFDNRSI